MFIDKSIVLIASMTSLGSVPFNVSMTERESEARRKTGVLALLVSNNILGTIETLKGCLIAIQILVGLAHEDHYAHVKHWRLELAIPAFMYFAIEVLQGLCLIPAYFLTNERRARIDVHLSRSRLVPSFLWKEIKGTDDENGGKPVSENIFFAYLGATRNHFEHLREQPSGPLIITAHVFTSVMVFVAVVLYLLHLDHKFSKADGFGYFPLGLMVFSGKLILFFALFVNFFSAIFLSIWGKFARKDAP